MPAKCGCGTVFMPIARMRIGDDGVPEFYLYGILACPHCDVPCGHAPQLTGDRDDFTTWERSLMQRGPCELCSTTRKTVRLLKRAD